jgi:hypothetical protein
MLTARPISQDTREREALMATFDQVTVTGGEGLTEVGFQTNAAEGGPIAKGAEITGDSVGVKGISGAILDDQPAPDDYGSGVYGISGSFPSGSGVTGQGAPAQVNGFVSSGPPVPPGSVGGTGVAGYGGPAEVGVTFIEGGDDTQYPQGAPAGSGISGVGGAGTSDGAGTNGPAGPGVVGQGGTPVAGQPGGTGVIGASGGEQFDPSADPGYGGVFISAAQGQVRLVPDKPSSGPTTALPKTAKAGDLFAGSHSDAQVELWFCVSPTVDNPQAPVLWSKVTLGSPQSP